MFPELARIIFFPYNDACLYDMGCLICFSEPSGGIPQGGFFMNLILNADKISKSFGNQKIFESVSLKIYSGDRTGIIGPNGAGKTTLLKILAGIEKPDEGFVRLYSSVSYIAQQDDGVPEAELTVNFTGRLAGGLGMNLQNSHSRMSGGERAKARFMNVYNPDSGFLIADEPTSNMDMESSRAIANELEGFRGTLLIVSHDRDLLDRLCTGMIEVDNGAVRFFPGNYSDYASQRDALFQRQTFEYAAYVKERERLKNRIIERTENMKSVRKAPSRMGNSEARLHKREATAIQKKLNQSIDQLESRINKLEKKEKPKDPPQVVIKINPPENPISSRAIRAKDLTVAFGAKTLLYGVSFEIPTGKRTAVLGKNGTGKTTLANMINARDERLDIAPGVVTGYFMQDLSILDHQKTILENLTDGSSMPEHQIRGVLARLLISADDIYKKVHQISGGEKVKVSIAKLLVSKANTIILDEPTNYLDVFSMEALEKVLCDYPGTLLLISHDRKFIENVAERILTIENGTVKTFEGSLKEYEESLSESARPEKRLSDLEASILKMRLAELSAKIYSCADEKKKTEFEEQYRELVRNSPK